MNWTLAIEEERAMLKRIVALLFSLADLAVLAGTKPMAIRTFVLWLLLGAEAVARNHVTLAPAPCPFHHGGTSRADAMRLSRRLRNLARSLDRQVASIDGRDGMGLGEVPPADRLRSLHGCARSLAGLHTLPPSMQDALGIAHFPDTS